MKQYLLTIIMAAVLCGIASAQSEFMNGYIIKKDGSYSYGQLKYTAKGYSMDECVFRWFDISNEYTFEPGDIEAFGFTHGMRYKSVTSGGREIFMACLADGELDLLYDGKKLFLDGMGLDMVQLDNDAGSINMEGKMVNYNNFRDLIEKLPDPENKFTPPADISMKPEKITEIIAAYNMSRDIKVSIFPLSNPSGVYEEMRNLGAYMANYGVLAGMNASKYYAETANNTVRVFLPEMDFFEMTPVIGFWYNRPLKRGSDIFSIQGEIMAFRTKVYIYNETVYTTGTTRSDINFSYTGIKVPLFLRASFLKGSYKPFISFGGYAMYNLGTKYTREGEVESTVHVVRPFVDNALKLSNLSNGGLVGIGIKKELNPKQSFSIEFRAESGTGIYDHDHLKQHTLSFNVIAGFDFR